MEQVVRTVIGAQLQTAQLLGIPLTVPEHSTLNEKFNIHSNISIADTDSPSVKYISIGNGGHKSEVGGDGFAKFVSVPHRPKDCALYNHLPFVMKLPVEDLSPSERIKYRLRRLETHDGTIYVAYYLKVLDLTLTSPQLELRSVDSGVTTVTAYLPTAGDLNPSPPIVNSGTVLTTSGDYIAATAKVPFVLGADEIEEFINVCNIIYGDTNYAVISEMALCSGVDKNVPGDFNGTTTSYTDAIAVQVVNFISTNIAAKYFNTNLEINLDIGSVEPLLVLS